MTRAAVAGAVAAAAAAASIVGADLHGYPAKDPLSMFSPERRAAILAGAAVVEVESGSGSDIAIAGAARTSATGLTLASRSRDIERLHGGRHVPMIRRFSSLPTPVDLDTLMLEEEELEDLRDCRPGRCALKLSADDIAEVQRRIEAAGRDWKRGALEGVREVLLARVRTYLDRGFAGLSPYHDQNVPVDAAREFREVMSRFERDPLLTPRIRRYLERFPHEVIDGEAFVYWSKDLLGDAKPIVSLTHLAIFRETDAEPATVVAAQISATHYLTASLSLTAVVAGEADAERYLRYARRSRVDVFEARFGGFIRRMVARRVRGDGPPLLDRFRRTLEAPAVQR